MKKLFVILMMVCAAGCGDERGGNTGIDAGETGETAPEICEISMDYPAEERLHRITGERMITREEFARDEMRFSFGGMEGYYDTDNANRLTVDVACGIKSSWSNIEECYLRRTMMLIPISDMEYAVCNIREVRVEYNRELEDYEITNLSQVPSEVYINYGPHPIYSSCVVAVEALIGDSEDEFYTSDESRPLEVVKCGQAFPKWRNNVR